jgi:hypothetical protein
MAQITFKFDKNKDVWNIWNKCNRKSLFGSNWEKMIGPKLIKICKGKTFEKSKKEIEKYNSKLYNSDIIEVFIKSTKKLWNKKEKEFFRRLEKITKKPFKEKLTCYVTTITICPYNVNEKWFMCSLFSNLTGALLTIGHETLHFHFIEHDYKKIEKQIGKEKTEDLKESLTVLLNLEFNDLFFNLDNGYPNHQELRKFIKDEWKKEKNYNKLLIKCVEYLKKS